jgi:hypothetical protein
MPSLPAGHRRSIVLPATNGKQAPRLSDQYGRFGGAIVEGSSAFDLGKCREFHRRVKSELRYDFLYAASFQIVSETHGCP